MALMSMVAILGHLIAFHACGTASACALVMSPEHLELSTAAMVEVA